MIDSSEERRKYEYTKIKCDNNSKYQYFKGNLAMTLFCFLILICYMEYLMGVIYGCF